MRNLFPIRRPLMVSLLIALSLVFGAPAAMADGLDDAQGAGLVGEKRNGYLGIVSANAGIDIQRLVQDINLRRRDRYKAIADATSGTTLSDVESLAGAKLISVTPVGEYVQDASGAWVRK